MALLDFWFLFLFGFWFLGFCFLRFFLAGSGSRLGLPARLPSSLYLSLRLALRSASLSLVCVTFFSFTRIREAFLRFTRHTTPFECCVCVCVCACSTTIREASSRFTRYATPNVGISADELGRYRYFPFSCVHMGFILYSSLGIIVVVFNNDWLR